MAGPAGRGGKAGGSLSSETTRGREGKGDEGEREGSCRQAAAQGKSETVLFDTGKEEGGTGAEGGGETCRSEKSHGGAGEAGQAKVEVVAEADPVRMTANTKAWSSRMLDKEFQKPLYSLNTYTDTQIVSDPRLRVEQALREAGLHQSRYATKVLSEVKPLKPPRRDTKSMLKF